MREKDIRAAQLEELKSGIFSGTYGVDVRHFDGRKIEGMLFANKQDCINYYNEKEKAYRGYASVKRFVVFDF